MGKRGPAPTPTKLKLLRGNPGKRAIPKNEPQPPSGAPKLPAWLSAEAKSEWRRVVPVLKKLGLLSVLDGTALGAYCQAHAELVEATKILDAEGRMIKIPWTNKAGFVLLKSDNVTPQGFHVKVHPMVNLQRDAFTRVKQFLSEFGLSPSSRVRLGNPKAEASAEEEDPLQQLINRAKKRPG